MFCITRSLMPSRSSSLVTGRLLLVRLRNPVLPIRQADEALVLQLVHHLLADRAVEDGVGLACVAEQEGRIPQRHFLGDADQRRGGADHRLLRAADQCHEDGAHRSACGRFQPLVRSASDSRHVVETGSRRRCRVISTHESRLGCARRIARSNKGSTGRAASPRWPRRDAPIAQRPTATRVRQGSA